MDLHKLTGGCHCGNIRVALTLTGSREARHPRGCDCDFCRKHGAAYISDSQGMLRIDIKDERNLARYKQGDEIADFLICKQCGVLVGVSYQEGERIYATINRRAIDNAAQFGEESAVSPKLLSEAQKVERWKENWFRDVIVDVNQHAAI